MPANTQAPNTHTHTHIQAHMTHTYIWLTRTFDWHAHLTDTQEKCLPIISKCMELSIGRGNERKLKGSKRALTWPQVLHLTWERSWPWNKSTTIERFLLRWFSHAWAHSQHRNCYPKCLMPQSTRISHFIDKSSPTMLVILYTVPPSNPTYNCLKKKIHD